MVERARRGRRRRQRQRQRQRVGIGVALGTLAVACASPPAQPENVCSIFSEKRSWERDTRRSRERWGVPEAIQMSILFQESSFRARARPPRRRFLGFIPGRRPSSAYGYAQVIDETWQRYREATGRRFADRDDFGDAVDFIGWYADHIQDRAGLSKVDAYGLYLAYHEGPGGFRRGHHRRKPWLLRAARQVEARALRYRRQYALCRNPRPA